LTSDLEPSPRDAAAAEEAATNDEKSNKEHMIDNETFPFGRHLFFRKLRDGREHRRAKRDENANSTAVIIIHCGYSWPLMMQ